MTLHRAGRWFLWAGVGFLAGHYLPIRLMLGLMFGSAGWLILEHYRLMKQGRELAIMFARTRAEMLRTTQGGLLVMDDGRSIHCLLCGRKSWNKNDVEQKFCGFCHEFAADRIAQATAILGHA